MRRILLYFNTVKYLKLKQIFYRVFYFLRNKLIKVQGDVVSNVKSTFINFPIHDNSNICYESSNKFLFLNKKKSFGKNIDWNFSKFGKLWCYNLNYFDFLNQDNLNNEEGVDLINDFIKNHAENITGKEPYPISLRGINWVKFLSKNKIENTKINTILLSDYTLLVRKLEYHLLGNHLLENGFSLLFGAYFFKNEKFYEIGEKIVKDELEEQILNDGGHFELSSMYHQIILYRLLDLITLLRHNKWKENKEFKIYLVDKAQVMLSYLDNITYNNGDVPMVNDSAYNIAPDSNNLFNYAKKLNITYSNTSLSDSGYRKFKNEFYELFIDIGKVGPKYQAGHAHADMLSFELHYNNRPFIVDTGTSTYENNKLRQRQRGTDSHNTVIVDSKNQSQVWGGFRVASRAKILKLEEQNDKVIGSHNGYKKIVGLHTREFQSEERRIIIKDIFSKKSNKIESIANFHFHSDIYIVSINDSIVKFSNGLKMVFESSNVLEFIKNKYELATGFNKTVTAEKLSIRFYNNLETKIEL